MAVKAVPTGFHTITPFLKVKGAKKVLNFVKEAFGATEVMDPMTLPDGTIKHVEVKIGDSIFMMAEAPTEQEKMPVMLYLYVEDVDAVYAKAMKAGGTSIKEPEDQFYGDRSGGVKDASGNEWWIATHKEDVSPEEMKKRMEKMTKEHAHSHSGSCSH